MEEAMKSWLAVALVLVSQTARADQCEWIDAGVAQKAQAILAKQPLVIEFCEPCGDKAPGTPAQAKTVAIGSPQSGYKEIQINGKAVDLAYTYVKTSGMKFENLAMLSGCPAQDVSPSLTVADETKHGVLITASADPVPQAKPVIATVPVPLPVIQPPRETVYMYSTQTIPWLALVFACASGMVIGAGLTITTLALRRRRAMKPRATDL
jgi:hypothetical protein